MFLEGGVAKSVQPLGFSGVGEATRAIEQQAEQERFVLVTKAGFDDEAAECDLAIRIGFARLLSHAASPPLQTTDLVCELRRWGQWQVCEIDRRCL